MTRLHAMTLAALVLAAAACGGDSGFNGDGPTHYVRVFGIVEDETGEGVPRIRASIDPDSGFALARQVTDDDGDYSLTTSARFTDSLTVPDSVTLRVEFRMTEGRHRDSLLAARTVRLKVVPVSQPESPLRLDVEVTLP